MSTNYLNQAYFEQTFSNPLDSVDRAKDDLRKVAELVWFHNFVPKLDRLSDPDAAAKAAYVVDYLASNHLVSPFQKKMLKQQLEVVRERLKNLSAHTEQRTFYTYDSLPRKNRDDFAKRWGFATGMKPMALGLIDMQRRANQTRYKDLLAP